MIKAIGRTEARGALLDYAYTGRAGVVTAFLSDSAATRSGHETLDFVPEQERPSR
jgi:hypothetical protein